jgi:hypothetical protein
MAWSNVDAEDMTMFDSTGTFTKQFTPFVDGYVYFPSRKAGDKFVSVEEYDRLVSNWRRVAGRGASWIWVGFGVVTLVLWTILCDILALPPWTSWIVITLSVAVMLGRLLRAGYAPRRLLASRPDITPPRPRSQARRQARAMIGWPIVVFGLLLSGAIFFSQLRSADRTPSWWAWVIGSGLMLGAYIWIGFQKLADRKR